MSGLEISVSGASPMARTQRRLRVGWLFMGVLTLLGTGLAMGYLVWRLSDARPLVVGVVVGAGLAYLGAHVLRAIRLFLLLNDGQLRLGRVAVAHLHAAGVSSLIPFKLGELYRIAIIGSACGDPLRAVVAVWIERVYDIAAVILLFSVISFATGAILPGLGLFLALAAAFLLLSFLIFLVLPENLGLLKRYLVLRHNKPWVVRVLAMIDCGHRLLRTASAVWHHRIATIIWLGMAIWILDMTAILIVVGGLDAAAIGLQLHGAVVTPAIWTVPEDAATPLRLATVDLLVILACLNAPALLLTFWRRFRQSARAS